ncbi:MAG: hypothetical protein HY751_09770 [Nitrospinae bacterium]|nr:hypothetical protein [Nitrospinota bacterium]
MAAVKISYEAPIRGLLEDISRFAATGRFETMARNARSVYDRRVGVIHSDDTWYETRMVSFMEWFIFDYAEDPANGGKTIFQLFLEENTFALDTQNREIAEALAKHEMDVFRVKWSAEGVMKVTAIFKDVNILFADERSGTFKSGDLFSGRALFYKERWYLSNGLCVHPSKARRTIKKEMKGFRKTAGADIRDYLLTLTAMSLKWERSRNIDINDIYKPVIV